MLKEIILKIQEKSSILIAQTTLMIRHLLIINIYIYNNYNESI